MKKAIIIISLIFLSFIVYAQDDSSTGTIETTTLGDDDFNNAEDTVDQTDTQKDYLQTIAQQETLVFSGSFNAAAIAAIGWVKPEFGTSYNELKKSAAFTSDATLVMNAKPAPSLDVYGNISVSMPLGTYTWIPNLGSIYCTYKVLDLMYIKTGNFGQTFGQGRLFTPANILSGTGSAFSLTAALPTILKGLTFGAYAQDSYFKEPTSPSYDELAYSAKLDFVLGPVYFSNGYFYQSAAGHSGALSIKTYLLGIDLLTEGSFNYNKELLSFKGLAGFFWERSDPKIKIYGEAQYCENTEKAATIDTALALGFDNIFGSGFDAGVKWFHSFTDDSGSVTIGASVAPLPLVTITFGVPFLYGEETDSYIISNPDILKRRPVYILQLKISSSF